MVGTILPIVHGERRRGKLPATLWLHTIGYLAGAAIMGGMLGAFGGALPRQAFPAGQSCTVLVATGSVSILFSLHELSLAQMPMPQCRWQVPPEWRFLLPCRVTALCYGLGLGFGLATRIPVSTFYPAVLWAVLVGSPLPSALGMSVFGLGRALPLIWAAWSLDGDEESFRLTQVLHRWKPMVQLVNGLALGSVGSCLVVAGLMLC